MDKLFGWTIDQIAEAKAYFKDEYFQPNMQGILELHYKWDCARFCQPGEVGIIENPPKDKEWAVMAWRNAMLEVR